MGKRTSFHVYMKTDVSACREACRDVKRAHETGDARAVAAATEKLRETVRQNTHVAHRTTG
jgi:hypothetical protein